MNEISKCSDPRTGPQYFIENYFYLQNPTRGKILFSLYDYQIEMLNAYVNNSHNIHLVARQMGKTQLGAAYILWYTLFNFDKRVIIGSNKFISSVEILNRIKFAYDNLPNWLKDLAKITINNKSELSFDNRSSILVQAVTSSFARGFRFDLIYLDEFAYTLYTEYAFENTYPYALQSNASIIINSSAKDEESYFTKLWHDACHNNNSFVPLDITWHRHPDRTQTWADDMKDLIGIERFGVEYENIFSRKVD